MRWQFFKKAQGTGQDAENIIPIERTLLSADCLVPTAIRCPLCGRQFHAGEARSCAVCGLAEKCGVVMCPNCSYEFAV